MPTILKTKNSVTTTVVPTTLQQGELAVNITDKKLWVGNAATTPVQLFGAGADGSFANLAYTGTLTGGTGVVNLGSGQFYKDASGNIGLGTTTPAQKLQVGNGGANDYIQIGATGSGYVFGRENSTGEFLFNATQASPYNVFKWQQSGTERMRIANNGFVGINTNAPSGILDVVNSGVTRLLLGFNGTSENYFDGNLNIFRTAGATEVMRTTSAGNVYVGATSTRGGASTRMLVSSASATNYIEIQNTSGAGASGDADVLFSSGSTGAYGVVGYSFASNALRFFANSAERMRIDSSGNVGIGVTPTNVASYKNLEVRGSTGGLIYSSNADGSVKGYFGNTSSTVFLNAITSHPLLFGTADTERMRILSNGDVCVGTTASSAKFSLETSGNSFGYISLNTNTASTANYLYWGFSNGATRFIVYGNGGIANYQANDSNLSDRNVKKEFAPAKNYLDTICSIPVQTFKYIDQEDNELNLGVVAQDVQAVAPELVTESNWGKKDDPKMRLSVYQTDLQYALMKSIQELKVIVDAQAARIAALESK